MDREQLGIVGIVDGLAQAMDEMAGHVVQHYKNILDAQAGCTPWTPRVAPSFPLIVTLEDWWIFTPTVVGLLSDSVDRRLGEAGLSPGLARDMPYTIVSIDELEIALQVISETGIAPFLNAKNDDEHRSWSVRPFAMSRFPDEVKRSNRVLFADEWDRLGDPAPDR